MPLVGTGTCRPTPKLDEIEEGKGRTMRDVIGGGLIRSWRGEKTYRTRQGRLVAGNPGSPPRQYTPAAARQCRQTSAPPHGNRHRPVSNQPACPDRTKPQPPRVEIEGLGRRPSDTPLSVPSI